jgi:hypothetical protein
MAEVNDRRTIGFVFEDTLGEALVPHYFRADKRVSGLHRAASGGVDAFHEHQDLHAAVRHVIRHHVLLLAVFRLPVMVMVMVRVRLRAIAVWML